MRFLTKWIPASEAEIDETYNGYKGGNLSSTGVCYCSIVNKGDGVGWMWGNEKQTVTGITEFQRDLNWQEIENYHRDNFSENDSDSVSNLWGAFNDMEIGDAHHEMWNGWVTDDFYELNTRLKDNNLLLIGICFNPPYGCLAFGKNSCAYIAEDKETGDRFWCHGSSEWVKSMRDQMQEHFNRLIKDIYFKETI